MSGDRAISTHLRGIRAVSVPVDDQDAALAFYTGTLGFTTVIDAALPTGGRFLQLAPADAGSAITLEPAGPQVERGPIRIRFATDDTDAAHRALTEAGVDVDEILRWPGVPPMFTFRDPDGNTFSVTE